MSDPGRHPCAADPGIADLAEDLRLISDPNRLRIICLLSKGERRVSEVVDGLGLSQQLASHHLNALREKKILSVQRKGTSSYYSVTRERLQRINTVFFKYLDHRRFQDGKTTLPGGSGRRK